MFSENYFIRYLTVHQNTSRTFINYITKYIFVDNIVRVMFINYSEYVTIFALPRSSWPRFTSMYCPKTEKKLNYTTLQCIGKRTYIYRVLYARVHTLYKYTNTIYGSQLWCTLKISQMTFKSIITSTLTYLWYIHTGKKFFIQYLLEIIIFLTQM